MSDLTKPRWQSFLDTVVPDAEQDEREAEADKPGCNDAPDPDDGASTIVSRFWTDAALGDLATFVDPRSWVELGSPYWLAMDPLVGPAARANGGYEATFKEIVMLPSGRVEVPLGVRFTRGDTFALTEYWVDAGFPSPQVRVDEGCVLATARTSPPGGLPNLVYSTKTIEFTDELLDEFTDLACDNGWVDLMIRMALPRTRRRVPTAKSAKPGPGTGDPIDGWAASLQQLATTHVAASRTVLDALKTGELERAVDEVLAIADSLADVAEAGVRASRHVVGQLAAREGAS